MTTTATPAPNETKPDATATPAPAANATDPAVTDKGTTAPVAADPKATGTAPAADPAPAPDAGEAVDDGDDSILDFEDDDVEPAKEGDKPAEGEGDKATEPDKDAKPATGWAQERATAADAYIAKIEKKLATGKDGKPLSARQKQAAVDDAREKFLAKLARYPSMTAALIAGINAQDKISSGKYKAPLADDATDDELAAWRKDNGIPDDAKGYKLPKVQGDEWTDADKPGIDKLLGRMHEKNASQAQVDAALTTYKEIVAEAKAAHAEHIKGLDKADMQATRDALRDELEGEFKPAMTLLKRLLGDPDKGQPGDPEIFPDDEGKLIAAARDPVTGKRLINNPTIARFLINYVRDRYGEGSMISGDQQAAANTEEQEILNLMKTDIDTYNYKPWKTTGMTASARLLEIRRQKEASGRGRRAA